MDTCNCCCCCTIPGINSIRVPGTWYHLEFRYWKLELLGSRLLSRSERNVFFSLKRFELSRRSTPVDSRCRIKGPGDRRPFLSVVVSLPTLLLTLLRQKETTCNNCSHATLSHLERPTRIRRRKPLTPNGRYAPY